MQGLTILGSTGTIGVNTLDVVARNPAASAHACNCANACGRPTSVRMPRCKE